MLLSVSLLDPFGYTYYEHSMTQYTALLLTLCFELSVLGLWWRWTDRGRSLVRYAMAGIAASCMTHPIAWWANETIGHSIGKWARLGTVEVLVVVCEALIYWYVLPLPWRRGVWLSALANAVSFGVGLVIFMYLRS